MKKRHSFILILLCVLVFAVSYVFAEKGIVIVTDLSEKEVIPEAGLPKSAEFIEDEAFGGVIHIQNEMPDAVASIEKRAFAGIITHLRRDKIPCSTTRIADIAFDDSNRTTIIVPVNSCAGTWAGCHGLPFSLIIVFRA